MSSEINGRKILEILQNLSDRCLDAPVMAGHECEVWSNIVSFQAAAVYNNDHGPEDDCDDCRENDFKSCKYSKPVFFVELSNE